MYHSMKMFVNSWKNFAPVAVGTGLMGLALHDAATRDTTNMDCTTKTTYIPGVGPYPMQTCVPKEVASALKNKA